jgi:hypothetical protein
LRTATGQIIVLSGTGVPGSGPQGPQEEAGR